MMEHEQVYPICDKTTFQNEQEQKMSDEEAHRRSIFEEEQRARSYQSKFVDQVDDVVHSDNKVDQIIRFQLAITAIQNEQSQTDYDYEYELPNYK